MIDPCAQFYWKLHQRLISTEISEIRDQILEASSVTWDGGNFDLSAQLSFRKARIETLDPERKAALLSQLLKDDRWKRRPERERQFFQMLLYDEESWLAWIDEIKRFGLRQWAPVRVFDQTIEGMPEHLRTSILRRIAQNYAGSKNTLELHPYRDLRNDDGGRISTHKMQLRRAKWISPKRIFDLMIHMISKAPAELEAAAKADPKTILQAYDRYLSRIQEPFNALKPTYTSSDILAVARAMQIEIREISLANGLTPAQSEVILYGSFPTGLANIKGEFDFDLALASQELASGRHIDSRDADTMSQILGPALNGSRRIELAGVTALKNRTGSPGYDPFASEHKSISIEKMYGEGLDLLSPIMLKITPDSIHLTIRSPRYRPLQNSEVHLSSGYEYLTPPLDVPLTLTH